MELLLLSPGQVQLKGESQPAQRPQWSLAALLPVPCTHSRAAWWPPLLAAPSQVSGSSTFPASQRSLFGLLLEGGPGKALWG